MSGRTLRSPSKHGSDSTTSAAFQQSDIHQLPQELLELIFSYVFHPATGLRKSCTAILRTCSTWQRLAEPFLYQNVSLVERSSQFPRLAALTAGLKEKPELCKAVKTLTMFVYIDGTEHVENLSQLIVTRILTNLKSLSIHVDASTKESMFLAMSIVSDLLRGTSKPLEALHVRFKSPPKVYEWLDFSVRGRQKAQMLSESINKVGTQCKYLRLELPPMILSLIFLDPDDHYPKLERLVICWTYFFVGTVNEDEQALMRDPIVDFLDTVAKGNLPNLKYVLMLKPDTWGSFRDHLGQTQFTCVEKNVKRGDIPDNIWSRARQNVSRRPSDPSYHDELRAERRKLRSQEPLRNRMMQTPMLREWDRYTLTPRDGEAQRQDLEFRTFKVNSGRLVDELLEYKEVSWSHLPNDAIMPRQMAGILGFIGHDPEGRDVLKCLDNEWREGLSLIVADADCDS